MQTVVPLHATLRHFRPVERAVAVNRFAVIV
jgi:hypothetical protein